MCDAVQAILAHDGQGLGREAQLQIQPWNVDLSSITQPVRLRHSRHDEEIPFAAVERTLARLCDARLHSQPDPRPTGPGRKPSSNCLTFWPSSSRPI